MTTTPKKLVVLGAGTAGTMVVNKLHRALPAEDWIITVVDRDDIHDYQPGYLFMAFGTNSPEQVRRHKRPFISNGRQRAARPRSTASTPRPASSTSSTDATCPTTSWSSPPAPRPVPTRPPARSARSGTTRSASSTPTRARSPLRDRMAGFNGGRLVVHITEMPIKCPVAPLEFTFLADDFLTKRGLRDRTEIVYVTPLDGAFTKPVASEALGSMLEDEGRHRRARLHDRADRPGPEGDRLLRRARGRLRPARDHPAQHGRRLRGPLRPRRRAQLRAGRQAHDAVDGPPGDLGPRRRRQPAHLQGRLGRALLRRGLRRELPRAGRRQADDALLRRARQLLRRVRARQGPAARLQLRHPAADRPLPRSRRWAR